MSIACVTIEGIGELALVTRHEKTSLILTGCLSRGAAPTTLPVEVAPMVWAWDSQPQPSVALGELLHPPPAASGELALHSKELVSSLTRGICPGGDPY